MKNNKAVTLVALIITVIILLILAGVVIAMTIGDEGIINKSQQAVDKYDETSVREKVTIMLAEYAMERTNSTETLEEYLNEQIAERKLDEVINNGNGTITVGVDGYKVTIIESDLSIAGLENTRGKITTMKEMLNQCGIDGTYTIDDIANNKEGSLEKILKNDEAIKFILDDKKDYIDKLIESKEAMTLLGKNSKVVEIVINSDELCEKIANSEYRKNFNEYIVYNAGTLIGTMIGRTYNKLNDGFALASSFYYTGWNGANFMLVAKSYDSALGWSSYNPSSNLSPVEIEFEGEKWYYSPINWGGASGESVGSADNGKYLGTIGGTWEDIAIYMLNDFYGKL